MRAIGTNLCRLRAWRQVMRDAKRPPADVGRLAEQRLKSVLVSAYRHVPFYREAMEGADYHPIDDYRGPEDLSRLPITTKIDLKKRGVTSFVREGADLSRCYSDTTSGSTGIPLRVYRDSREQAVNMAKWLRVLSAHGYSMRDKVMSFANPVRMGHRRSAIQRLGLLRRLAVSYQLPTEAQVDALCKYEPDVLYAGRSSLDLVAWELERRGIELQCLKLLVGTGEAVPKGCRRLYRQHFGTDVVESYGTVEMGVMAYETPERDGLYLSEDRTFFEFLDQEGRPVPPGEPGRVVVTDLTNMMMPFIRYDQGDLAIYEHKDRQFGAGTRRLTHIIGRDDDLALLPDGTRLTRPQLVLQLRQYEGIMQFRIVQQTLSFFQILIVADTAYLERIRGEIQNWLQNEFPSDVRFEIIRVDRIEPDPSGKLRSLVSFCESRGESQEGK